MLGGSDPSSWLSSWAEATNGGDDGYLQAIGCSKVNRIKWVSLFLHS